MMEFKPTDVVRLKSGGSTMVIIAMLDGNRNALREGVPVAVCLWHDEHGVAHEHAIPVDCLVKH